MFQIDLSPDGDLQLHLPTGRAVEIEPSPAGVNFIIKILRDHARNIRNQPGYIGTFPTQAVIDKWQKTNKEKLAEERQKKVKADLGIDLDKLEITI